MRKEMVIKQAKLVWMKKTTPNFNLFTNSLCGFLLHHKEETLQATEDYFLAHKKNNVAWARMGYSSILERCWRVTVKLSERLKVSWNPLPTSILCCFYRFLPRCVKASGRPGCISMTKEFFFIKGIHANVAPKGASRTYQARCIKSTTSQRVRSFSAPLFGRYAGLVPAQEIPPTCRPIHKVWHPLQTPTSYIVTKSLTSRFFSCAGSQVPCKWLALYTFYFPTTLAAPPIPGDTSLVVSSHLPAATQPRPRYSGWWYAACMEHQCPGRMPCIFGHSKNLPWT